MVAAGQPPVTLLGSGVVGEYSGNVCVYSYVYKKKGTTSRLEILFVRACVLPLQGSRSDETCIVPWYNEPTSTRDDRRTGYRIPEEIDYRPTMRIRREPDTSRYQTQARINHTIFHEHAFRVERRGGGTTDSSERGNNN